MSAAVSAAGAVSPEVRGRRALVIRLVVNAGHLTVGGREVGNNGGTLVNGWQRVTGNGTGDAWCLSWVLAVIMAVLTAIWPARGRKVFPLPLTGSCDAFLAAARQLGIVHEVTADAEPAVGDLVLRMARGSTTDATHAMLVVDGRPGPTWGTTEGNTNNDGSRDGVEVCEHVHGGPGDTVRYLAVRWIEAIDAGPLLG